MTIFYDRATISGQARITKEGYFVADALVAKANNIQEYRAAELGLTDRDPTEVIRVFRPEREIFAVDSLKTASRMPITLDHPPAMVDANNWREFARGETGEEILRDGEFLRVPIRVTDAGAVMSVQRDRQEFSLGYAAKIEMRAGEYQGQAYDAELADIRYNHLAACKNARGGPELRITDERDTSLPAQGVQPVNAILVDGFSVNLTDAAATGAAISKLVAERDALKIDISARDTTITARDAELVTKGEEITRLTDDLAKAKLTPAQLRDAAAAHAKTIADAKRLGVTVTDDMSADDARKAAVAAKMGDKAAAYDDAQLAVAFDTLVAGLPADGGGAPPATPPVRDALGAVIGDTANVVDANQAFADARAKRFQRMETAHTGAVSTGA
jgi:hypothetical protein